MKIGVIIGRIGGEDGVALETEKWIQILQGLGHQIRILSGELEGALDGVDLLPELAFSHPDTSYEQSLAFFGEPGEEAPFLSWLEERSEQISSEILSWIASQGIQALLIENASALPCHLRMGMAIKKAVERSGLLTITHDHDFAWERGRRYQTPFPAVEQIIQTTFPLNLPQVRHAVINQAAQSHLKCRGIEAVVVPNVMEFGCPYARLDEYNREMRQELGLEAQDLLLFQVTRIIRRKGIETAIELVKALDDPRVKLIITGTARDDDPGGPYLRELKEQSAALGLKEQVLFMGERFDNQRSVDAQGRKIYSLEDAYSQATACTYFSSYEGFGNAFVEAVLARRPIFLNNYHPVYWPDIGSKGFQTVMLEKGVLTSEALERIREILYSPEHQAQITEKNHRLGSEHFSFGAIRPLLEQLFS